MSSGGGLTLCRLAEKLNGNCVCNSTALCHFGAPQNGSVRTHYLHNMCVFHYNVQVMQICHRIIHMRHVKSAKHFARSTHTHTHVRRRRCGVAHNMRDVYGRGQCGHRRGEPCSVHKSLSRWPGPRAAGAGALVSAQSSRPSAPSPSALECLYLD